MNISEKQVRQINRIIVHTSASDFGDVESIRKWHLMRGFVDIGYHFVILNGHRNPFGESNPADDGLIEIGRPWWMQGAHTKGHNNDSIGICLVGNPTLIGSPERWFTSNQLASLKTLVRQLMGEFRISSENIHGHNEYAPKLCPGFWVQSVKCWWE